MACANPNVQMNVYQGDGEIDTTATWEVVAEYDGSASPGEWGPCDLETARAVLVSLAGRTNVRKATIQPVA